jgi:Zn-dependent protease with chaperone function
MLILNLSAAAYAQDDDSDESVPGYIADIEQQFGLVTDPQVLERMERIRASLVDVIVRADFDKREIVVKVLDDPTINAFALPNGYVYFFKGLVAECETDDMLAGVMAHEFTHVIHRHHSRMGDRQITGLLIGLGAMIASGDGEAAVLGQMLASSMVETYGRSAEEDADKTGVLNMIKAGYDPLGYIELLQVLEQASIHNPEPAGNYFTVHPWPEQRMNAIRLTLESMGYEVPDRIYRVHLPLRFYTPLNETELSRLNEWRDAIASRAENADDESGDSGVEEDATDEIPLILYNEYLKREELFTDMDAPPDIENYGIILLGSDPIFYIAADSQALLVSRAENIIFRLGDLAFEGLREHEVSSRTSDGVPYMIARRRIITETTELDAELLGKTLAEVNADRVETLKNALFFYFVNSRI